MPLFRVPDGVVINILWKDVASSNTASESNLLPWSSKVTFSIPPILDDHAKNLAPVPSDTLALLQTLVVEEFPPTMFSPAWKIPVSVLNLLITSLLFFGSSLKIVPVAFEVEPVIVSPFWNPVVSSKYR